MSWWVSKRGRIINTSHYALYFVEEKLSLLSEDLWIINVQNLSTVKKTALQTSLGQSVFLYWETDRSRTTQQGTQLKRHRCLQHLMNNQKSKAGMCLYLCSVTQQVAGLKEDSVGLHFSQTKLYNHAANSQEPGEIKACNCTGAAQDQEDHLFRTFWFHNSPEFTHISKKKNKLVWFSTGLCQVTDGPSCFRKMRIPGGSFSGVGPG